MKLWVNRVAFVVLSLVFITACHRGLVATTPVPPQQAGVEIYPSKKHIWVPGKHRFRQGNSDFRSGRYRAKSNDKPVWIAAHWKKTPRGYVWVPAKWKKF